MSKRELNNVKATEQMQIKFRVSLEEKQLLNLKKEQYHYKYLSNYIRDACIYENIVVINVAYTDEVNNLFQTYIDEVRKFTKEVRRVMKYDTSASVEQREMMQQALYRVYSSTKSLKKSVNNNLNIDVIVKQSKERLYKQQVNELERNFNAINNEQ